MAYGLFVNTICCYTGINDPSEDTTLKIVFNVKANQRAEVFSWVVNSRLSKIKTEKEN